MHKLQFNGTTSRSPFINLRHLCDLVATFIFKAARHPLGAIKNPISFHRCAEYCAIKAALPKLSNARVLDVGGSYRVFPVWLLSQGFRVDVMDIDSKSLDLYATLPYTARYKNTFNTIYADITSYQQSGDLYDVITCVSVIEHIHDDILALHKMKDLLKPNGRLILSFPVSICKTIYYNPYTLSYTPNMIHERFANIPGLSLSSLNYWITSRQHMSRSWLNPLRALLCYKRHSSPERLSDTNNWQNFAVLALDKKEETR